MTLVDERVVHSITVVLAPGSRYYTYRRAHYNPLHAELVSHLAEHDSFDHFSGKSLLIMGGGQSTLETAALAYESGTHVSIVASRLLFWIRTAPALLKHRPLMELLLSLKAGIGPGWLTWRLEHFPYVFQRLLRIVKERLMRGVVGKGSMGAAWLKPRVLGKGLLHGLQGRVNRSSCTKSCQFCSTEQQVTWPAR